VGDKILATSKKALQSRSNLNVILIVFIVHHEFVPRGETVNKEFYLKVVKLLREAVRRNSPEAWTNKTWMLHYENAPAHASLFIREVLAMQETIVVPQPPYCPELAPADFSCSQS
jgi:hypothetical protein